MICQISLPVEAIAGLPFAATVKVAGQPAPAIKLHLRGPSQINLTAAQDGTFSATAAETAEWQPGDYWWTIREYDAADQPTADIESGTIILRPDPVAAVKFDGRSENEKALEAIEALLAKRATLDQERYRINNRELWRTPMADLLKLRSHYARLVAAEKRKACGRPGRWGRLVQVNF